MRSYVIIFLVSVLQVLVLPSLGYRLRHLGTASARRGKSEAVAKEASSGGTKSGRLAVAAEEEGGETEVDESMNKCGHLKRLLWDAVKKNSPKSVSDNLVQIKRQCKWRKILRKSRYRDMTPLMYAASHNFVDVVNEFLGNLPDGEATTGDGNIEREHVNDIIKKQWWECYRLRWLQTVEVYEGLKQYGQERAAYMWFAVNVGDVAVEMCFKEAYGFYYEANMDLEQFIAHDYKDHKIPVHDETVDALGAAVLNASHLDIVNELVTEEEAEKYSMLFKNMSKCNQRRWRKIVDSYEHPMLNFSGLEDGIEQRISIAVGNGRNTFMNCCMASHIQVDLSEYDDLSSGVFQKQEVLKDGKIKTVCNQTGAIKALMKDTNDDSKAKALGLARKYKIRCAEKAIRHEQDGTTPTK